MKKQSARARAQSTPPVRHQLEHQLPTVIHNPEEDMTALGRWAHRAMLEPRRYLAGPLAVLGGVIVLALLLRFATGGSATEAELWRRLETAKTPADRVDIARADPKSPAASWAKLQAATEFYNQALADMPNNRDVALPASKKALDLFDEVVKDSPQDSPQARFAALGKARVLEMRNELPRAIEQYQLVARDWPNTPEAEEAVRFAEALRDPRAAEFYKELHAYSPTKVTLPPFGTETLPPPGGAPAPGAPKTSAANPATPASAPSDQPPTLSPDLGAIPGIREVIEPRPAAAPRPAPPKGDAPDAKAKTPDLPADVFSPKSGESKPQ